MKNALEDAKNQPPKNSSALVAVVKKSIQLSFDESGWSKTGRGEFQR